MAAGGEAEAGIASPVLSTTDEQQTLNVIAAGSLGLGLICVLRGARPPKPISLVVGVAHGALKAARAFGDLRFPPRRTLLFASKSLIKGYKASKRLDLIRTAQTGSDPFVSKQLAAYLRVLNVVRYARCFLYGEGTVGLGFLSRGYKLSKNLLKVLEGFSGNRFDCSIRDGLDAVGLIVKAATVAAELERIAMVGRRGSNCGCGFTRRPDSRRAVHSKLKRMTMICGCEDPKKRFPAENIPPFQTVSIREHPSVITDSELLCLSIPLSSNMAYP